MGTNVVQIAGARMGKEITIRDLLAHMDRRFDRLEENDSSIRKRLDDHDKRLQTVEKRSNLLNYAAYIIAAAVFVNVMVTSDGSFRDRVAQAHSAFKEYTHAG